jgi:hypothetical protein
MACANPMCAAYTLTTNELMLLRGGKLAAELSDRIGESVCCVVGGGPDSPKDLKGP